ncbi:MAG: proline--tRNA ligase [Candidatus Nanopelagicales bacterium]|nr:proline--tRNA ligase [Candidatus Nanopelagicales bacterium]
MLRMSTLFLRTLREDPADAEVPSHRLLVRAGYIRRVAPGVFTWLPLGYEVYRRVESVVRAEMNAAGFQEVHFPALLPREPYELTNRWTEYGDTLFRLQDRKGADYLLGPTHEEMFTLLVKGEYSSYKDLPVSLYQIQSKFRDEARPRAGILRGREFVMKDSYSFDIDDAGLQLSYDKHRAAYVATFTRLGLEFVIVSAMSGAMGGSASEEFLAPTPVGEDSFVRCAACGFAANVEAVATVAPPAVDASATPAAHVEQTPASGTIEALVSYSNRDFARADRPWSGGDTLKNVLFAVTAPDGERTALAIGVPGDREIDPKRLEALLHPSTAEPFEEADFARYPSLVKGYIGPSALGAQSASGIRYLVDPRVVEGSRWITGANEAARHYYDFVAGRDFTADGVIDVADVRPGDACERCGSPLEIERGIEIGHIFQLGRKYAEAVGLKVQGEHGELITVTMGSYGIGVSRAVAAVAEQSHDDKGLIWPREIAPADVHLIAAGKDTANFDAALALALELEGIGLRVLYDDRTTVSPGVKFNDSELIGIPTIVIVGKRLADGFIEVKDRRSGERQDVALADAVATLTAICRS